MNFKKLLSSFLVLTLVISTFSFSNVYAQENTEELAEKVKQDTGVDVSEVSLENFEYDFSFLVNDITFNEMEEYLVLTGQDVNLEEYTVQAQWVPVVAGALRLLTSKVGKEGMQKGWAIAKPYVKKALDYADDYVIDGPGGGGRIIQVRKKKGGAPIFRLDYYPIKTGGDYKLHYHVEPDMKEHHVIF
ncbi:hypothetical protein ACE1MS_10155 [Lysinibacillus sp. fkY74-1]|uniref:hypothetical protein n=1 Tax=Lysinibacillus TaxID=400634 RepID=UPI00248CBAC3|nr:hypothetical protein [Lysinibacillus sphaericus]MDM5350089.1 hypothetical protein [Lysinibacillus sphaericus]